MTRKIILLGLCCGLLSACAEKMLPESESIQVLEDSAMAGDCRHFANALIKNTNLLLNREKQEQRLLIKAKNLAHELGADTVMPMPSLLKDRQSFRFYLCNKNGRSDA